jgi:hypothetical protein
MSTNAAFLPGIDDAAACGRFQTTANPLCKEAPTGFLGCPLKAAEAEKVRHRLRLATPPEERNVPPRASNLRASRF